MEKEFAKLPHYSVFGTDNRAIRDAKRRAFAFLLLPQKLTIESVRAKVERLDDASVNAGEVNNVESKFAEEMRVLDWAIGVQCDW
jgi:hypothetical protein